MNYGWVEGPQSFNENEFQTLKCVSFDVNVDLFIYFESCVEYAVPTGKAIGQLAFVYGRGLVVSYTSRVWVWRFFVEDHL